jgi:ABC-type phosphate/phosphonate transport system substrate-binding protein
VTWEFLRRYRRQSLDPFRVIAQTEAAPAPPLVTAAGRSIAQVQMLRRAFKDLVSTEDTLCSRLLIQDFVSIEAADYAYMAPTTRRNPRRDYGSRRVESESNAPFEIFA